MISEDMVDGYIVAANSNRSDENKISYISYSDFRTVLDNVPVRHVILVLNGAKRCRLRAEWLRERGKHALLTEIF
jgi:hypothetical protein